MKLVVLALVTLLFGCRAGHQDIVDNCELVDTVQVEGTYSRRVGKRVYREYGYYDVAVYKCPTMYDSIVLTFNTSIQRRINEVPAKSQIPKLIQRHIDGYCIGMEHRLQA